MRRFKYYFMCLSLILISILGLPASLAAKPQTIPAIQEWVDAGGVFNFGTGRIVLEQSNASALTTTAQVFQDDILALKGVNYPIINGTQASLVPGDIFLSLKETDSSLGTDGYKMIINDRIILTAINEPGVFYGTRTLLQLFKQKNILQGGTARDFPRYPLRGLHIDNGRKFITTGWLKNHIKELAYLKMNLFHWHLAEWSYFRLESSSHPEIVAAEHYTKSEIQDLLNLAAKYHVTIMPEFDMPGHMNWALNKHPELTLIDKNGTVYQDNLDLTKDASYKFIKELLDEWVPLFKGPYFHIGTDEYIWDYTLFPQYTAYAQSKLGPNANAKDLYFYFINWANDIVRSYNKTTWAWDDSKTGGSVLSVNKNVIYDSWTFDAENELKQGHSLINSSFSSLYYNWQTDWEPMQTQLYEQWAPHQWSYGSAGRIPAYAPGLLGAKLELWFDNNQGEEYSVAYGLRNPVRTVAQQTWASPKLLTQYSEFKNLSELLGHAPGTSFPSNLPPKVVTNGPYRAAPNQAIAFSSSGTLGRSAPIVSYRWDFGDGGSSNLANPTYTYKQAGTFSALLFVKDNNGMTGSNDAQITIGASQPVSVVVTPNSVTLTPGALQQFQATVTGNSNTNVTWSASGGTISSAGLYTAPQMIGTYTVKATSVVDTNSFGIANINVATAPSGNNLALNKPTTASTEYSSDYSAPKATDNDPINTRWCARNGTNGQWLLVDLGASANLSKTSVKWESNGIWQYKIEVSLDKVQWQVVIDKTKNTVPAQTYEDNLSTTARYVRITATTNQPGHWASIYDFQVWGVVA